MITKNTGLITESNRQYYAGSQGFRVTDTEGQSDFTFTFDTKLQFGSYDPEEPDYALNNFKVYLSEDGLDYVEYIAPYTVIDNTIAFETPIDQNFTIVVQLKTLDGGYYGDRTAYGVTVEENYGGYQYISLTDIVYNFIVAYVGTGKIIEDVKRTDILFHAKRGLQEFSYDTLKSVKSQELSVPHNLTVPIPQDYVNYVKFSWVDRNGVKHPIMPKTLTSNPGEMPLQDNRGVEMQDNFDNNVTGTSITEGRWAYANGWDSATNANLFPDGWYGYNWGYGGFYGQNYGLNPQYANVNGSFTINDRDGKINFSSDLIGRVIIFEYISDGLAYDADTKVPKLAEEAMYAYLLHAIVSTRKNQPEYLVQRLKQEKNAKLRNAKIRLSNIKLEEFTQVMRGQSKWIKH